MSTKRLGQAIGVLLLVGAACYFIFKPPPREEVALEPGTVYYTGPYKGKNGTWGLPDGTEVPPPADQPADPGAKGIQNETF